MSLPATFTREQIQDAFTALAMFDLDVASVHITATQVDVELHVPDGDGYMHMLGEMATVTVTIPIDEDGIR